MPVAFNPMHVAFLAPRVRESYVACFGCQPALQGSGMVDRPLRFAHFLAQCCHETGGLTVLVESMHYRAERIRQVWPSRFPTLASAQPFAGNPSALAEKVYGGRMGNTEPGDGFRFIGRGLLQLSGRANYTRIGRTLGLDLAGQPHVATRPEYMLLIALEFWRSAGCDVHADADDIQKVTRAINGGQIGIADRRAWLAKAKAMLGLTGESTRHA